MRRINVDQLRRGSSSNFADHRYCLELSTSSIASFEPGSIVPRSSSIPRAPASSIYVLSLEMPALSGFPALFISLRYVAGISRAFWISRAFCRPTSCRWNYRAFVDLRDQASISRVYDLPRLRSPASFTLELYYCRVLLRHSIESVWI